MENVEITVAQNGWLVWEGRNEPHIKKTPLLFTDWAKLSRYLRKQLAPKMKDVE